jgi:hypothetical protein
MTTIHVRRRIESETLHLPELKPLIGKTVEILVVEELSPLVKPGTGDWAALEEAARNLEGYDFDAWRDQRDDDLRHANDYLPWSAGMPPGSAPPVADRSARAER